MALLAAAALSLTGPAGHGGDAFEGRSPRYSWRDPGFPQTEDDPATPANQLAWELLTLCRLYPVRNAPEDVERVRSRPKARERVLELLTERPLDLPERSLGMSGDLAAAVRAGTTMIRVGTALFGPRPAAGGSRNVRPDLRD